MARPRKRKRGSSTNDLSGGGSQRKKVKTHVGDQTPTIRHTVLDQFYLRVCSLRDYLLSQLPPTSKIRRKKVAAIGKPSSNPNSPVSEIERSVGGVLDNALVGVPESPACNTADKRWEHWATFSQKGDESYVSLSDGNASSSSKFSQPEVGAGAPIIG